MLHACLLLLLGVAPAGSVEPLLSRTVKLGGLRYQYNVYRESLPGRFLFTPRQQGVGQHKPFLVAMDSEGKAVFEERFFGIERFTPDKERLFTRGNLMLTDFKALEPGRYGYFVIRLGGDPSGGPCWRFSRYHFLDAKFRELEDRPIPRRDADLDGHEAIMKRNGNMVFLFYREEPLDGLIDAEIQEWDPQGSAVFTWNSKDSLRPPSGVSRVADYLHANSIDEDADGGLLLGLATPGEVVKIEVPSGKILWTLSSKTWKFANDSLNGFRYQHSVRRLDNGNLLMFDNGGGSRGEVSRAVEYKLDHQARVATLVWEHRTGPGNPFRQILGSAQRLSNGNTLIGWGGLRVDKKRAGNAARPKRMPFFTEVDPSGAVVRELLALDGQVSYRVFFEPAP